MVGQNPMVLILYFFSDCVATSVKIDQSKYLCSIYQQFFSQGEEQFFFHSVAAKDKFLLVYTVAAVSRCGFEYNAYLNSVVYYY